MSDPRPDSQKPEPRADAEGEGLFDWLKGAFGLRPAASIREDLADALQETDVASEFSPEERQMLRNILSLRGQRVEDIMVPRADIVAVPLDITLIDLLNLFRTAGHSRLPVYNETLDDPRGMVHIRDFVSWLAARAGEDSVPRRLRQAGLALPAGDLQARLGSVGSLIRAVLFVPPSMPPIDLLAKMQTSRTQLALVIDEYGGTDGLVSMEDIVEIVVGDIEDEHDVGEAAMIVTAAGGSFVADARAGLDEVSAAIGTDLVAVAEAAEADVDTLGGWLVTLAGRVPVRGEIITGPGALEFEIVDADPRRVKRVRIHTSAESLARPREAPVRPAPRRERGEGAQASPGSPSAAPPPAEAPSPSQDVPRP